MIDEISGDLLQWLRGFYCVADRGSITQATVLMRREQPTITRQIKCLEKELGVTLFDRSSGKMKLTAEGRILFDKAISLFEDVREIRSEFKKELLEYQGRIVIAASHAIIDSFLPPYILAYRRSHPRVSLHIEVSFFETVYEKIESGEADFGIAFTDSASGLMVCHDLFATGQKLIALKGNPFFPNGSPTLAQIAAAPLVLFSRAGSIEPFIVRGFADAGLSLNVVMTVNNFVALKKFVSMGLGVGLLSGYAVSREDEETMDIFDLDEYFPKRKVGLIIRKRKYLSPAVKAFIRLIKPDITFAD
jgi:DNA-binding transcriptional LysR family regulator